MVDKNNDDFGKRLDTFKNNQIPSASLHIDDFPITGNKCSKITNNEAFQSKSYCYSKLTSMDFIKEYAQEMEHN
jgi:hypothetical protein